MTALITELLPGPKPQEVVIVLFQLCDERLEVEGGDANVGYLSFRESDTFTRLNLS